LDLTAYRVNNEAVDAEKRFRIVKLTVVDKNLQDYSPVTLAPPIDRPAIRHEIKAWPPPGKVIINQELALLRCGESGMSRAM
jgi:hypothetical protein